jgi:hypothetical protein
MHSSPAALAYAAISFYKGIPVEARLRPSAQNNDPSTSLCSKTKSRFGGVARGSRGLTYRVCKASRRCGRLEAEGRSPKGCAASGLMRTRLRPALTMPSFWAAPCERSIVQPQTNGPRSVMRTRTDFPLARFVTSTGVPSGSVG